MAELKKERINNGIMYMQANNYTAAIKEFKSALDEDPKDASIFLHLGNAYTNAELFSDAEKAFKTALMLSPDDGRILYNLGGLSILQGKTADGIRYYNRAEAAGYTPIELYTIRSGVFAQEQDYAMAIREMGKAISLQPLNGELYATKARLEVAAGMPDQAQETADSFMELLPDAFDAYSLSVDILCMQEKYGDALLVAERGLSRFPDDVEIRLLMLKAYVEAKKYTDAESFADELLSRHLSDTQKKQAVLYHAAACAKLNKIDKSIDTMEKYVSDHSDQEISYLLMNTHLLLQHYNQVLNYAEDIINNATDTNEIVVAAKYYHADALKRTLNSSAANEEYKRLTSDLRKFTLNHPDAHEVYIFRLLSHAELQQYEKALELADFLVNAYPESADGHMYKHYIYKKQNKLSEADHEKNEALKIDPSLVIE